MAKEAKAETETAEVVPKKKSKKLLIMIIVLVVVLLIVGGGVAFLLMKKNSAQAEGEGAAPAEQAAVEKAGPPVYAALDTFTVNLVGDQYLQLVISVEVKDAHIGDGKVHALGPRRRDDMGRIACQEKTAMAHGLRHEAAHGRDALLDDFPLIHGTQAGP